MLRTNLLPPDKSPPPPPQGFHSLFSYVKKSFGKNDPRNDHCAQRSSVWVKLSGTGVHLYSNWGMFTVAKRTEISQDTQYYLWKKALCLCCIAATISGVIALKLELQSVEVYSTRFQSLYCCAWKFRLTIRHSRAVELVNLHFFPTVSFFFSSLISKTCNFVPLTPTPITFNCAGKLWRQDQTDIFVVY